MVQMFYYIDHLRTPFFPTGLVKTKSNFIVGLVETDSGRGTLVVAVFRVDAYPFLAFSDLTCHLEDAGIGVFWLKVEVVTKRLLHQQVTIPG